MPEPTKIRALFKDGGVELRILMAHEMESGQRLDAAGNRVPAWYITQVHIFCNDRRVFNAQLGPGVSKNPFFHVRLRRAQVGDTLRVVWLDNRGQSQTDQLRIA